MTWWRAAIANERECEVMLSLRRHAAGQNCKTVAVMCCGAQPSRMGEIVKEYCLGRHAAGNDCKRAQEAL